MGDGARRRVVQLIGITLFFFTCNFVQKVPLAMDVFSYIAHLYTSLWLNLFERKTRPFSKHCLYIILFRKLWVGNVDVGRAVRLIKGAV